MNRGNGSRQGDFPLLDSSRSPSGPVILPRSLYVHQGRFARTHEQILEFGAIGRAEGHGSLAIMDGRLHVYHPKRHLNLFEYRLDSSEETSSNVLLFVGGMYDNFLNPVYVSSLASALSQDKKSTTKWTLMHVQLSSAGTQFGMSNLDKDVEQVAVAIEFIRKYVRDSNPNMKLEDNDVNVVLMGHSTGCQDVLHYLTSPVPKGTSRPAVQGVILQAPVSDREGLLQTTKEDEKAEKAYHNLLKQVGEIPKEQWNTTILPFSQTKHFFGPVPMSTSRFMSLASPGSPKKPGQDDLFSSDVTDERLRETFGSIGTSAAFQAAKYGPGDRSTPVMLILICGADEYMPSTVDKDRLLGRWVQAVEHKSTARVDHASAVLAGAKHDIGGKDDTAISARDQMKKRVMNYLDRIAGDATSSTMDLREMGSTLGELRLQKSKDGKL